MRSVRTIVNNVLDASGAVGSPEGISPVQSLEWISPGVTRELDPGGVVRSLVGISPARATPESTHARTTANAKCLISYCFSFELRNANLLA